MTALFVLPVVLAACSSGGSKGMVSPNESGGTKPASYVVGMTTQTFVDSSRVTAANGSAPQLPQRTLVTTILYPAVGTAPATGAPSAAPMADAPPDKTAGPYPLIAFSHGTGATPQAYMALLTHWAEAGYVVAAPKFPLSSGGAPGGVDVGDVANQPADISFVIKSVLSEAASKTGVLAGLVNRDEVGAAGHSLGAITTLGVAANTCCKNPLVKAALVMAGSLEGYPNGEYEVSKAPPLFVISGTDDAIVPYSGAVEVFNEARGPKALLKIKGGDHGSSAGFSASTSGVVLKATTDFFDAYLKDSATARQRLAHDGQGSASVTFVPEAGSTETVPTVPAPKLHLQATATPTTNLHDGQAVTVTWSGYTPGKAITLLQCTPDNRKLGNSAACDFHNAALLHPNPTGEGSLQFTVTEGKVGNGVCDATHTGCFILVDNASSSVPADNVFIPISFAR